MKHPIIAGLLLAASVLGIEGTSIPPNSKVYIGDLNGFGSYVTAAVIKKKLPLQIVADKEMADFEITGNAESEKPGWARTIFLSQRGTNEQASINLVNLKSGVIVFGYAVNKMNSVHGKQSAAEACAKHLKRAMEKK